MYRYLYFIFIAFLISCSPDSSLECALELSGENRNHLQYVLDYYSRLPKDSLKYKAVCFLIENMPGHYWYEGKELETYRKWIDSVYKDIGFPLKMTLYEAYFQQKGFDEGLRKCEDIIHIKSDFLIRHIDYLFEAIEKRPWLNNLTFEQFCEHILPYRVGYEPPQLYHKFQDSLYTTEIQKLSDYDDIKYSGTNLSKILNDPFYYNTLGEIKLLYKGKVIAYNLEGCVAQAVLKSWLAKLGLYPVSIDFIPAFPDKNNRHCWVTHINNHFNNGLEAEAFEREKLGKIYRKTYAHNFHPLEDNEEYIPLFFREPFYKDVTSYYTSTRDVIVKPLSPVTARYAYLCVFNDLKWEPIAYAKQRNGKFLFKEVGRGVVYQPAIYEGGHLKYISYPFVLCAAGKLQILKPKPLEKISLKLKRKYPQSLEVRKLNECFLYARIEASDDSLFRKPDSIGIFLEIDKYQWSRSRIHSQKTYRYWRICSDDYFTVAECVLYDSAGKRVRPSNFTKEPFYSAKMAFDNDPLSYAWCKQGMVWDMGEKKSLSRIECLLRNDGNEIWPGHWYELLYNDGKRWHSLGIQEAKDYSVTFHEIPANALMWLKDLTTGNEERIFVCENNEVRFW